MLFAQFLEETPPNCKTQIEDLFSYEPSFGTQQLCGTDIQIHCESDRCNGKRSHEISVRPRDFGFVYTDIFIVYECRNCRLSLKYYSLRITGVSEASKSSKSRTGDAMKFGEIPPFGPTIPSRVVTLFGADRDLLLKGRRCENQGLGVGAYAYYRQMVENQKGRLFSEIKKIAERSGAKSETLALFDQAIKETQFSKAVDDLKDAIPSSLLIDGHNPLKLLHSALSQGLHDGTDVECLELAHDIRVVLSDLAERISVALKDEAELKESIGRLMSRGQKKLEDKREKKSPLQ